MSNHINNRLLLGGPAEEVARLEALALGKDLDGEETILFEKIVPPPTDPAQMTLEWQIENWGCKWGAEHLRDQSSFTQIDWLWSTPNLGAHPVIAAIAEQFPLLSGWYGCGESACDWVEDGLIEDGVYTRRSTRPLDAEMALALDIPLDDEDDEDDDEEDDDEDQPSAEVL